MSRAVFLIESAELVSLKARELLDAIMAFASFDQAPVLIFRGDALWLLHSHQNAHLIDQKPLQEQFRLLSMMGLSATDLWTDEASLNQLGLDQSQLCIDLQRATTEQ
ncbi:MAG: DsrE family protein, partial [Pseudomonadota bacterium]|nr:DsrE family protein [Pseudomonadota bacterium]